MKNMIFGSAILLVGLSASASTDLTCWEGQETVVTCNSTQDGSSIQQAIICKEGSTYTMDTQDWRSEVTGQFPVNASHRTGASVYSVADDELQVTLVVAGRPVRNNGQVVRPGKIVIKDLSKNEEIPVTCVK